MWASITALQPALSCERFLTIQAVVRAMSGISELQTRKASLVHIASCSCVYAFAADIIVKVSAVSIKSLPKAVLVIVVP